MTAKSIEIEVRGPLPNDKVASVKEFLATNGSHKGEKHRVLVDYSSFLEGGIRNRTKDIRIRTTNGQHEIIIKLGSWGGSDSREEIPLPVIGVTFDTLAKGMKELGYGKGVVAARNSSVYEYDGMEVTLVEIPGHSYFFEIEQMADRTSDKEDIKIQLIDTAAKLGLACFSDEEFFSYVELLNREVHPVYDAEEDPEDYFQKNFGV